MNTCTKCGCSIKRGGFVRTDGTMLCAECFDVRPLVQLQFDGASGNSLAIVGACQRAARSAGWSSEAVEAWSNEALSGDRDHLVDTVFEYFEVGQVRQYVNAVDRRDVR